MHAVLAACACSASQPTSPSQDVYGAQLGAQHWPTAAQCDAHAGTAVGHGGALNCCVSVPLHLQYSCQLSPVWHCFEMWLGNLAWQWQLSNPLGPSRPQLTPVHHTLHIIADSRWMCPQQQTWPDAEVYLSRYMTYGYKAVLDVLVSVAAISMMVGMCSYPGI